MLVLFPSLRDNDVVNLCISRDPQHVTGSWFSAGDVLNERVLDLRCLISKVILTISGFVFSDNELSVLKTMLIPLVVYFLVKFVSDHSPLLKLSPDHC